MEKSLARLNLFRGLAVGALLCLVVTGCGGTHGKSASLPPPPAEPSATSFPACLSTDLSPSLLGTNAALQQAEFIYLLTNISANTCALTGYPTVTTDSAAGPKAVAPPGVQSFWPETTFAPYAIPPGSGVDFTFVVELPSNCLTGEPTGSTYPGVPFYHDIRVYLIDGSIFIHKASYQACGEYVGPYIDQEVIPETAQLKSLKATVNLPSSIRLGTTLHYTVSLHNPTSKRVDFSPCPAYTQVATAGGTAATTIDCHKVPSIGPNSTIQLKMNLPLAGARVPGDSVSVDWRLYSCWTCVSTGNFANTFALDANGSSTVIP